jgi:hypothetical protein
LKLDPRLEDRLERRSSSERSNAFLDILKVEKFNLLGVWLVWPLRGMAFGKRTFSVHVDVDGNAHQPTQRRFSTHEIEMVGIQSLLPSAQKYRCSPLLSVGHCPANTLHKTSLLTFLVILSCCFALYLAHCCCVGVEWMVYANVFPFQPLVVDLPILM